MQLEVHRIFDGVKARPRDSDYSVHRAQLRNQPKGTAIYSAVDYDAQPSDMTQIKAFFTAFAKSVGQDTRSVVMGPAIPATNFWRQN